MKILIAIPCYNCAQQLPRTLAEFDQRLVSRVSEIMIIDNLSTDSTLAAAQAAARDFTARWGSECKIHIYQNLRNYGLGGTHKVAFQAGEAAGCTHVGIIHGDNQGVSSEMNQLIDIAEKDPTLDAILGARFMPKSRRQGYNAMRTLGNRALNLLYTLFSGYRTYDMGSGLNLFNLKQLRDHRFLSFNDAFTFNMDLLLDFYAKRAKLHFVPITWREADQISNAKMFRVGWITLITLIRWRLPLQRLAVPRMEYLSQKVI